jgi:hypothetical protein
MLAGSEILVAWSVSMAVRAGRLGDLRHLNEVEAGQDGFVRRAGGGFVLGNGDPVRFWAVQGNALANMHPHLQEQWARRLAKYGVNLVRFGAPGFQDWRRGNREVFRRRLDGLHRAVSALKREGIYSYIGHIWWDTSTGFSVSDGRADSGGTGGGRVVDFPAGREPVYIGGMRCGG